MERAIAVANYFVKKSFEYGDPITSMKVVKLVYLAHGWYLANYEEPLISDAVEAWKYGPVIQSVYDAFKKYGSDQITALANVDGEIPIVKDPEICKFLDEVYDIYRDFDGIDLSTISHEENSPWDITWNSRGGRHMKHAIIPNDAIQNFYYDKLRTAKSKTTAATA